MVLFAVLIADVESRQANCGATEIERTDRPDQSRDDEGKRWAFGFEEQQGDERGGGAEADGVGEAVELAAKIGCVAGEARQSSIQSIKDHRDKDQVSGGDE